MESGNLLHNRYRIVETLGKGGMGAVYRAIDDSLGVQVAVKENLFDTEEYSRQFRREATILANLRHKNLPRVTDHFVIAGQGQYLVMDFIEGEDLKQRLARAGALPEEEVILVGATICESLSYLHTLEPPVLHRDIKPGNIKVTPKGEVFLVDFGLAKVVRGGQQTTTGARGLTPGYSPPEQYGPALTDPRSDIYSLGATLYAALTGGPPEDGLSRAMQQASLTRVRDRVPGVSLLAANAIETALAVQPEERFQSAGEFGQALLQASEPARQRAARGHVTVTPPPKKSPDTLRDSEERVRTIAHREQAPARLAERPRPHKRTVWFAAAGLAAILAAVAAAAFLLPGASGRLQGLFGGTTPVAGRPTLTAGPPPGGNATATTTGGGLPGPETASPEVTEAPLAAPPTLAATPLGGGGQIAFASDRTGLPQIWLVNVDGSGLTQLTDMAEGACQPDWSPDGSRLVFVSPCRSNTESYPGAGLFVISADGTGLDLLPAAPGGDYDPAWSPDGGQIAFTSLRAGGRPQIWLLDLSTRETAPLSDSTTRDFQPAWSPDGAHIVFVTTRTGATQLWYMQASGRPWDVFSRDSDKIYTNPVWSPDGEVIVFTQSNLSGGVPWLQAAQWEAGGPERGFESLRIAPAYTAPMREPDFSPDGNWLVFESNPGGSNHDIFIVAAASGASLQPLTSDPAFDFDPAWRPQAPQP